jgi:23S rRNA (pseudouridine1915-N3)-methyltransferase
VKLQLIAFGKLKTPGLRDSADYYAKIFRPWAPLEEIELKPLEVPDKSAAIRRQIQEREAELLLKKLPERGVFYLLDEAGKAMDTQKWAGLVREWEGSSLSAVSLCVGSSLGFSDGLRRRARGLLSLGPQTMSHELARVVLMEQLYRAWSVTRGHPYHNEGS